MSVLPVLRSIGLELWGCLFQEEEEGLTTDLRALRAAGRRDIEAALRALTVDEEHIGRICDAIWDCSEETLDAGPPEAS